MTRSRPASWSRLDSAMSALRALQAFGPDVLVDRVASRLGLRRLWVRELRAGQPMRPAAPLGAGLQLRAASEADVEALVELRMGTHAHEPVGDRTGDALGRRLLAQLRRGDLAWLVHRGGRVLAMNWAARGHVAVPHLQLELLLGPHEAYFYDTFVARELRGQGLGPTLYSQMAASLFGQGVERIVTLVGASNHRSLHAMARAGFVGCGFIGCIPVPGAPIHFGGAEVAYRALR